MGILGHFPNRVSLAFKLVSSRRMLKLKTLTLWEFHYIYFVVSLFFFNLFLLVILWFLLGFYYC